MDTLFTNNKDFSSQIRYVLALVNSTRHANIIYQSFIKYKRVTRSVLALELYEIIHNFNISAFIKFIINKVLEINLLLIIYINSKSLYEYLVKLGITREKRLIINIIYLY